MSGCDHSFRNPCDLIGFAVLHDDGGTLELVDPFPAELIDLIHSSANRIWVRLQFVADDERMTDENGKVL
jgi:hypothetical protein